ncbi:MAG: acyl carrier protein [Candidatus Babeliaceae bacterium]|nr:acyl carrier protein [Candidatus Babeliaceae bacterium]
MAHDVSHEIRTIIAEQLSIPVDSLKDDTTLESLGADSLDRVEIVMNLEDHFSIEIDDEMAEKLNTVDDVVHYISTLVKK